MIENSHFNSHTSQFSGVVWRVVACRGVRGFGWDFRRYDKTSTADSSACYPMCFIFLYMSVCVCLKANIRIQSLALFLPLFLFLLFFLRQVIYDKALSENIRLKRMTFVCALLSLVQNEYL